MAEAVEAHYEAAGISWYDGVRWVFQEPDNVYNYYSIGERQIHVGAMPEANELKRYWQTWSAALTDGGWVPDAALAKSQDGLLLARYNQLVLSIHEAAHAVTYRYDSAHVDRHDGSINCREFYADRLTAAFLQEIGTADQRLADLETDYLALLGTLNAAVPEGRRYTIESAAALAEDCDLIAVEQPTPTAMSAYASAFFARHLVLLPADNPSLATLVQDELAARLPEQISARNFLDPAAQLTTIERWNSVSPPTGTSMEAMIAADGSLHVVHVSAPVIDGQFALSIAFGPPDATVAVLEGAPYPPAKLKSGATSLSVYDAVMVDDDQVLLLVEENITALALLSVERDGEEWTVRRAVVAPEGAFEAGFVQPPSGPIEIALTGPDVADWSTSWRRITIDSETIALTEAGALPVSWNGPAAADADGALFYVGPRGAIDRWTEAAQVGLIGGVLDGDRDGSIESAELNRPGPIRVLIDGTIRLVDHPPRLDETDMTLRELVVHEP